MAGPTPELPRIPEHPIPAEVPRRTENPARIESPMPSAKPDIEPVVKPEPPRPPGRVTLRPAAAAYSREEAAAELNRYADDQRKYAEFKAANGISETTVKPGSKIGTLRRMVGQFLSDWRTDAARLRAVRNKVKTGELDPRKTHLVVEVMDRNAIITDERFQPLWQNPDSRQILLHFGNQELFQEVNAKHWLLISGENVNLETVTAIIDRMGHNPDAHLSGYRGQNGGSIAIDNYPEDRPADAPPLSPEEEEYWKPVFESNLLPAAIRKWHMSRNHAVVYSMKDTAGRDMLMIPIHVDPNNWCVMLKKLSALNFHKDPALSGKKYLGTGLYDLGALQLIRLLQKKQPGIFADLTVIGENKLETTGTISGDVRMGQMREEVFQAYRD